VGVFEKLKIVKAKESLIFCDRLLQVMYDKIDVMNPFEHGLDRKETK